MKVRRAKLEDFDEVFEIFNEVHNLHLENTNNVFKTTDPLTLDEFKTMLEENIFLVALDQRVVGFMNTVIIDKVGRLSKPVRLLHIDAFGVLETKRNCGVGKILMDEAKKIAKENNCDKINLSVWSFNEKAINFYNKNGFKEMKKTMEFKI